MLALAQVPSTSRQLPRRASFDNEHRGWREWAVAGAKAQRISGFTHGVAAKLINTYLKIAVVLSGSQQAGDN